jgi:hypothetical protein
VAQLTVYLQDQLAEALKREAARQGQSLSAYVVERLGGRTGQRWPEGFFEQRCGFLAEQFPIPEDPAPEAVEW